MVDRAVKSGWLIRGALFCALAAGCAACQKQNDPPVQFKPEAETKLDASQNLPVTRTSTPMPAVKGTAAADGAGNGGGSGARNGNGAGTGNGNGNGSGSGNGNGTGSGSGNGSGSGSGSAGAGSGNGSGGSGNGQGGAGNGAAGGGSGSGGAGAGGAGAGGAGAGGSGASGGPGGGAGGSGASGAGAGGAGSGSGGGAGGGANGSGPAGGARGSAGGSAGATKGGGGAGSGADSGGSQSQLIKIADAVTGNSSAANQPFNPKRVGQAPHAGGAADHSGKPPNAGRESANESSNPSAGSTGGGEQKDPAASAGVVKRSGAGGDSANRTTPEAAAGGRGAAKDDATSAGATVQDRRLREESPSIAQPAAKPESTDAAAIPLPEVPDASSETGDAVPETARMAAQSKIAPLLGYWQQVDASANQPDFAPGGFSRSILAIRPTQRSMQMYRSWGAPPQLVIAAELRATFDLNNNVSMTENPSTPCRFSPTALELPATAAQSRLRVEPPAHPLPYNAVWAVEKDGELQLDGRLYRRMSREEFEAATRTQAAAAPADGNAATRAAAATAAPGPDAGEPSGGTDFFGTRVRGKYVCFVCDISGSMRGDKMIALRNELTRTIQALPAGSHFEVIFFSDSAFLIEPGWVLAGSAGARAFLKKIQDVGADGGTDANGALTYAFTKLNPVPHELFLLTDGHFGVSPIEVLKQFNGGADRTRVHTIGLGADADAPTLQAIAREYGGQYRAIDAASAPAPAP